MALSHSIYFALMATLFFISTTMGHSQMGCANYDAATGACSAPIRQQGVSLDAEDNEFSVNGQVCQAAWANPISSEYDNGANCGYSTCPLPMGSFTSGQQFTIMWFARNHATADQTPGNITLYMSPIETENQGSDFPLAQFQQTKVCTAPFMSCNGANGDLVPCYTTCTVPKSAASGLYTLLWYWDWPGHSAIYTTCADIQITGGSSAPSASSTSTTGKAVPSTSTSTTGKAAGSSTSTTGKAAGSSTSTTGKAAGSSTSTTGKASTSTTGKAASGTSTSTGKAPVSSTSTTGSSSSSSSSTCTLGNQRCSSSTTYQTCAPHKDGTTFWNTALTCPSGLTCQSSSDGKTTLCAKDTSTPSTPSSTSTSSAPSSPSTPTPTSPPSSSTTCTFGDQECVGTSGYHTCVQDRNGQTSWAATQNCQTGLSCHASATGSNIYCY